MLFWFPVPPPRMLLRWHARSVLLDAVSGSRPAIPLIDFADGASNACLVSNEAADSDSEHGVHGSLVQDHLEGPLDYELDEWTYVYGRYRGKTRVSSYVYGKCKDIPDSCDEHPKGNEKDDDTALAAFPLYVPASNTPSRALSLLSPKASSAWVSPHDLSSQSSAALRELIAENRAAVLARQLFSDRGWHSACPGGAHQVALSCVPHHPPSIDAAAPSQLGDGWEHLRGPSPHVTLDLMQMPGSSFEFLSAAARSRSSRDDDEECCEIWKSLEGTHVV